MATQGMQAVTSQAGHASQIEPLIYHYKVSDEFCKKVREITQRLEMPAEGANWLMAAMNFETGGTFSPGQKNGAGSGATGLIQFMPSTAKLLGTTTEKLAQMDAVAQLDYVEKYFESYKGKIHSLDDLYLVIFYPAALNKSDDFVLGSEKKKAADREKAIANIYDQNKGFDYKKNGGNGDHQIQRGEVRGGLIRTSYEQGLAELGRPVPSTTAQNKPAQTTATTSGGTSAAAGTHIVGSGDTLSKIAKMYNVAGGYQALAKYNNISNPSRISIGQVIKIPGAATQTEQPEQKTELENPTTSTETAQTTQAGVSAQSGVTAISEKGYVSGTGGDGLKVRKGGSTEYDKIGLLGEGQAVEIIGQASTGWYQIKYGSITGFVSNKYIKLGEAPKANSDADLAALGGGAVDASGVPLYKQGDSRWKSRILGKKKTIGQAGCAMTSTTMALNKISGQTFNPAQMDQYLDTHGGYSGDCIYWSVAAKYVGKSASSLGMSGNKAKIDKSLDAGRPCVISVKGTGHWVCVAGRNADGSYIINDPGKFDHPTAKWNGSAIKVNGYDVGSQLRLFS